MTQTRTRKEKPDRPGVIHAGEMYTGREFCARLAISRHTLAYMRRKGLRIRKIKRAVMILGRDAIAFLTSQDFDDDSHSGSPSPLTPDDGSGGEPRMAPTAI